LTGKCAEYRKYFLFKKQPFNAVTLYILTYSPVNIGIAPNVAKMAEKQPKKIFEIREFYVILGLTIARQITILSIASNKKEFEAKTVVSDQPNATNN
jgi:hypothetical protein